MSTYEQKRLQYRREFPILESNTWLNHAGHSPWSLSSIKAMEDFARSFSRGPMLPYIEWDEIKDDTRNLLAQMLNVKPQEIGFNFTTSLSLMMLSHVIDWKPGDNIIVPDKSFPAVVMPAKLLEQWDVEARIIETVDRLASVDHLIGEIDNRTKMMIVPMVNFLTGQKLDVPKLSKACKDADVFLVVDAIQAAGAIRVDVKSLGCHALCFGSPKWMFGPMGIGTIYLDPEQIDRIKTPQVGIWSVKDPWDFFDYDQPFINETSRYECGCSAYLSHYGMKPNLEMFLDLGVDDTEKYILELTGELHDELTSRGVEVITPRNDNQRAGIVTFDAKSAGWSDADSLAQALTDASITVSVRMGLVRVSPHFYNDRNDIDRFMDVVFRS